MYEFAGAAKTKSHRFGGLNNRHVLSPSSGNWKCKIKVLAELVPSEAVRKGSTPGFSPCLIDDCLSRSLHCLPSMHACIQVSLFSENPSQIGSGPTLMNSL